MTWLDGHRSVLECRPHTRLAELRAGPLAVVDALRSAGFPAPATEPAAQVGHAVVTVQELLPGTTMDRLDQDGLDQALALNVSLTGRLTGRVDLPSLRLHLRSDGPGYCAQEPLRGHGRRAAALERRVASVGAEFPDRPAGADAVHQDFHPGNLPALDDGSVTGVIGRGRRRPWRSPVRPGHPALRAPRGAADAEVTARLDAVLDSFPENVLRPAWAHMGPRMTDRAIRHFPPNEVGRWLDLAEQRADRPAHRAERRHPLVALSTDG
ncbi:phosphotransferase [Streptomyces sp. NPDC005151]